MLSLEGECRPCLLQVFLDYMNLSFKELLNAILIIVLSTEETVVPMHGPILTFFNATGCLDWV